MPTRAPLTTQQYGSASSSHSSPQGSSGRTATKSPRGAHQKNPIMSTQTLSDDKNVGSSSSKRSGIQRSSSSKPTSQAALRTKVVTPGTNTPSTTKDASSAPGSPSGMKANKSQPKGKKSTIGKTSKKKDKQALSAKGSSKSKMLALQIEILTLQLESLRTSGDMYPQVRPDTAQQQEAADKGNDLGTRMQRVQAAWIAKYAEEPGQGVTTPVSSNAQHTAHLRPACPAVESAVQLAQPASQPPIVISHAEVDSTISSNAVGGRPAAFADGEKLSRNRRRRRNASAKKAKAKAEAESEVESDDVPKMKNIVPEHEPWEVPADPAQPAMKICSARRYRALLSGVQTQVKAEAIEAFEELHTYMEQPESAVTLETLFTPGNPFSLLFADFHKMNKLEPGAERKAIRRILPSVSKDAAPYLVHLVWCVFEWELHNGSANGQLRLIFAMIRNTARAYLFAFHRLDDAHGNTQSLAAREKSLPTFRERRKD